MCTVSWFEEKNQIVILFSRDEQKSRGRALPPKIEQFDSCQVIKPTDPDAGGSWISVNQFGVLIGLLNLYEYQVDNTTQEKQHKQMDRLETNLFTSRGLLINQCCHVTCWLDVERILLQQDLTQYKPFRMIYIATDSKKQFVWDGQSSKISKLDNFLSSSGFKTQEVINFRKKKFTNLEIKDEKSLLDLHTSHNDRKDAYSICTHRDDGHTVSLSLIKIGKQQINYQYWDGSPCVSTPSAPLTMMTND